MANHLCPRIKRKVAPCLQSEVACRESDFVMAILRPQYPSADAHVLAHPVRPRQEHERHLVAAPADLGRPMSSASLRAKWRIYSVLAPHRFSRPVRTSSPPIRRTSLLVDTQAGLSR